MSCAGWFAYVIRYRLICMWYKFNPWPVEFKIKSQFYFFIFFYYHPFFFFFFFYNPFRLSQKTILFKCQTYFFKKTNKQTNNHSSSVNFNCAKIRHKDNEPSKAARFVTEKSISAYAYKPYLPKVFRKTSQSKQYGPRSDDSVATQKAAFRLHQVVKLTCSNFWTKYGKKLRFKKNI